MGGLNRTNVKDQIRDLIRNRGEVTNRDIAAVLGLTRQAVHHHLRELVTAGELTLQGAGRGVRYVEGNVKQLALTFQLDEEPAESAWPALVARNSLLQNLEVEVGEVLACATEEIVNNAATHSGATSVTLEVGCSGAEIWVKVTDSGVGVFDCLRKHLRLGTLIEAADQLAKGGVSSATGHRGEGLATIALLSEKLEIEANGFRLVFDNARSDIGFGSSSVHSGTLVRFVTRRDQLVDLAEILGKLEESPQQHCRARVKLFAGGTDFVSREEATKVARGLERFSTVEIDFSGITHIGVGFIDELFCTWAKAHPKVQLVPVSPTPEIEFLLDNATRKRA